MGAAAMTEALPQISSFALALAFSHLALWRWKLHERIQFWLLVEYLWLATAALGVVAIGNEVRRMDAAADIEAREQTVQAAYQEARTMALGGDILLEGSEAKNLEKGARESSWFRYAVESLELGYENDRWSHFLAQNADLERGPPRGESRIPQLPPKGWLRLDLANENPGILAHARLTLQKLRYLHDARESWRAARAAQSSFAVGHAFRNFREIVSWIVVFALALRITKVQADHLRPERRLEPLSTEEPDAAVSPREGGPEAASSDPRKADDGSAY